MFQIPKFITKKTLQFDTLGRTVYTATLHRKCYPVLWKIDEHIFLKPDIYYEALITTTPVYYKVDLFLKSYLQQYPT